MSEIAFAIVYVHGVLDDMMSRFDFDRAFGFALGSSHDFD